MDRQFFVHRFLTASHSDTLPCHDVVMASAYVLRCVRDPARELRMSAWEMSLARADLLSQNALSLERAPERGGPVTTPLVPLWKLCGCSTAVITPRELRGTLRTAYATIATKRLLDFFAESLTYEGCRLA